MPNREKIEHPSFGLISVFKTHGGVGHLFGSDVTHHEAVHVTIHGANYERDLSREWYHQDKKIVEFWMSEAQWAMFVSSFGNGNGTPITLRYQQGKGHFETPPIPPPVFQRFDSDIKERTARATDKAKAARNVLVELRGQKNPATKKQLDAAIGALDSALQDIISNLPFVAESFNEKMENTVNEAMIDFEAFAQGCIHDLGMEALASSRPELKLTTTCTAQGKEGSE